MNKNKEPIANRIVAAVKLINRKMNALAASQGKDITILTGHATQVTDSLQRATATLAQAGKAIEVLAGAFQDLTKRVYNLEVTIERQEKERAGATGYNAGANGGPAKRKPGTTGRRRRKGRPVNTGKSTATKESTGSADDGDSAANTGRRKEADG